MSQKNNSLDIVYAVNPNAPNPSDVAVMMFCPRLFLSVPALPEDLPQKLLQLKNRPVFDLEIQLFFDPKDTNIIQMKSVLARNCNPNMSHPLRPASDSQKSCLYGAEI